MANNSWEYDSTRTYSKGDYCIYNSKLYRCLTNINIPTSWTPSSWAIIQTYQYSIVESLKNVTDFYNSSTQYHTGDYCIYNNQLYKCLENTSGTWAPAKWSSVNIMSQLPFDETITLTSTLPSGQTTAVFQDIGITTAATYDFYTDTYGVNPLGVTVESGQLTMTFESRESSLGIKVRIS